MREVTRRSVVLDFGRRPAHVMRKTWLRFESERGAKRLVDYPTDWRTASAAVLQQICEAATVASVYRAQG